MCLPALPTEKKPTTAKSPVAISLAKPTQSPKSQRAVSSAATAPVASSASADLLGLCSPVALSAAPTTNGTTKSEAAEVVGDIFSNFLSGPTPTVSTATASHSPAAPVNPANVSLAKQEEDFFNQVAPTEQEKGRMTRDSIMALYAKAPTTIPSGGQFNGSAATGFHQFNGQTGFMAPSQQAQQPLPSQLGAFNNAQLLMGQLGSTASSHFATNGGHHAQQLQHQQSFANFGVAHQIPAFAQFPPMGAAAPPSGSAGFPLGNGFSQQSAPTSSNGSAAISQQFANLNMWQ